MERKDILEMISKEEISVEEGLRLINILEEELEEDIIKEKKSFKESLKDLDVKMKEIDRKFIKPNIKKGYKGIQKGFNKLDKQIVKLLGEDL